MNITHVITNISKEYGGTSTYLKDLLNALPQEVHNTLVCYPSQDDLTLNKSVEIKNVPFNKRALAYSTREFKKLFKKIETDVFHGNGLWDMPMHAMATFAKKRNLPYIMSPHGMMEPWSLNQSKLKKKIALKLYQHKDLKFASCIHATAKLEADNIRALGYKNPIAIIPNGISLQEFPLYEKKVAYKRKILFLSRIHPKKGIELLVHAWQELSSEITKDWEVEIVGNGDESYIHSLRSLIKSLNIEKSIIISEPAYGEAKLQKYRESHLFVLPTYSENFGIVVAEALALKTPVITTKGTPWEDLNIHNCGQWIEIGKDPLKQALEIMLSKSQSELNEMGNNGRLLIENKYSMVSVGEQMKELYYWLLNKNETPEFVNLQ